MISAHQAVASRRIVLTGASSFCMGLPNWLRTGPALDEVFHRIWDSRHSVLSLVLAAVAF